MVFALDAMGGDESPKAVVSGTLEALKITPSNIKFILLGDYNLVQNEFKGNVPDRITIHPTSQIVSMTDKPANIIKTKPDSSIVKGLQLVKDRKADAFISAGNTGAVMTASLFLLGRIKGVKRPALAAYIPNNKGGKVICDVGANPDAKPEHLLQFAIMAAQYFDYIEGHKNPRIGLINIGEEPNKGSELYKETYNLFLKELPNFTGNVEGRHLLDCEQEVLVCDGFVGNTILKFAESWMKTLQSELMLKIDSKLSYKIGAYLIRPIFKEMQKQYDYEEIGGTPLLGVNGISIICHGASGPKSFKNSILVAKKCVDNKLIEHTKDSLSEHLGAIA